MMTFETFIHQHAMLGISFEAYLYRMADRFSANYQGGYWKSKTLEGCHDFFYLELDDDTLYTISNDQNDYDKGPMDSKVYSLSIFAYALNTFGYHLYNQGRIDASEVFFRMYQLVFANALVILGDEEKHAQFYWLLD